MDNLTATQKQSLFQNYHLLNGVYDEFFSKKDSPHKSFQSLINYFDSLSPDLFMQIHNRAQHLMTQRGVTFNHYTGDTGLEKIFPFDLLPRVIPNKEWHRIEQGLQQRVRALNEFLYDVYHDKKVISDKIIPRELLLSSSGYLPQVQDITPKGKIYIHVAGIDVIRNANGQLIVLEDNLRVPSGISYVIENRQMMKKLFPELFNLLPIFPIENYPSVLHNALQTINANPGEECLTVVLTPGIYNSAYFEHSFLARTMGYPLVESHELYAHDKKIYLRCKGGDKQVHIIYRRIDDSFLDPIELNPESLLGVPGLVEAYRSGNIMIANALGNGVADDKSMYPFVPKLIKYYLNEDPILEQVETYSCYEEKECEFVLKNLPKLVIKLTDQSGGYGVFIGPQATQEQLTKMQAVIKANPRHFIAQPLEELSTCPTLDNGRLQAKRVDFRPYVISSDTQWITPGGLTRVALQKDSYIVNSSQGGGSKDTWVLTK